MQQKWLHSGFFAISAALFLYMCGIGINNIFRYNAFREEYEAKRQLLLLETRQNQAYKHQLSRLDDPKYWEIEAKSRLGYIRPGEIVYKVIPKSGQKGSK